MVFLVRFLPIVVLNFKNEKFEINKVALSINSPFIIKQNFGNVILQMLSQLLFIFRILIQPKVWYLWRWKILAIKRGFLWNILWYTTWKVSVFGAILVCIFPHSDWMRRYTEYLFVFSPNVEKCGPEWFRIRTYFTQC